MKNVLLREFSATNSTFLQFFMLVYVLDLMVIVTSHILNAFDCNKFNF